MWTNWSGLCKIKFGWNQESFYSRKPYLNSTAIELLHPKDIWVCYSTFNIYYLLSIYLLDDNITVFIAKIIPCHSVIYCMLRRLHVESILMATHYFSFLLDYFSNFHINLCSKHTVLNLKKPRRIIVWVLGCAGVLHISGLSHNVNSIYLFIGTFSSSRTNRNLTAGTGVSRLWLA